MSAKLINWKKAAKQLASAMIKGQDEFGLITKTAMRLARKINKTK